ncbi:ester cyclase [Hanstruepera ponticola]|uniref:ester cyclase n=1 Tax=Hanstruepera ponticola TaxID=2042995 RepID=UPI000CF1736E|nr:ester cyclase [Hanstruepera ponticola]
MKKLIIMAFAFFMIAACQDSDQRYTQQSSEIETVKKLINNYNNKTYDTSMYADSSKTFYNSKDKSMSPSETIAYHKANDENYSSRGFMSEDQDYEMVKTDDGHTWVNCWLDWKGTLAQTGKEVIIPIHLTYRFIDGKIVREVGMWDPTEVVLALQGVNFKNSPVMQAVNKVVEGWNAHDISNLKSVSVENLTRSSNGNVDVNNINEYEGFMNIFVTAFPDFKVAIDDAAMSGNKVYLNWTVTGTHNGDFIGNAPTGKKMKSHGFSVWTMNDDGKFTREDAYYDNLVLYNQLGLKPPKK